ncbi:MAG: hydrolase [Eubacteriales bacterium]
MNLRCFCPELTAEEFTGLDLMEFDLSGKTFYFSRTPMVSHFPMNPEIKIEKTLKEIKAKGFQTAAPLFAIFEDGLLSGKIMIEIVKPSVKDSDIRTLSDLKLIGRNFTGPKHLVPKALKQFDSYLMSQKVMTTEFFFWYHSCKVCEKEKGNRTIILGKTK